MKTETLTADNLVYTGLGRLRGIFVITDGSNSVTIDAYDNTSAAGTKMIPSWTITGSDNYASVSFGNGEGFGKGLYIDITTSGTVSYMVYYEGL